VAKLTDNEMMLIVYAAQAAAIEAGEKWMAEAEPKYIVGGNPDWTLLDLCGNAHVRTDDGRTRFAKFLKRLEPEGNRYTITLPMRSKFSGRQEHGLKMAMARAALKVLSENNIPKFYIWDYID